MAIKFGMKLAEIIAQLTRGFFKQTGRSPSGLDNIKIQQEALQRFKDMNKVVDMKGNPLNPAEGIMGGEQAQNFIRKSDPALYEDRGGNIIPTQFKSETEEQIKKRLMDQNKKSLDSMKKKLDEPDDMATGGRAGYYGGGQAMVGEDLSEIGHGSDALMARNMQIAPGGQATTSTGLNYLLGQDNDTVRVPYQGGGGADASTTSFSQSFDNQHGTNTASRANRSVDARQAAGQRDADRTNDRISNTDRGRDQALNNYIAINYPEQKQSIIDKIKNSKYNNPYTRGVAKTAAYMYNPAFLGTDLRTLMGTKRAFDKFNKSPEQLEKEQLEKEMAEVGILGLNTTIEGGMLNNPFMESQVGPAITRAENKYYEQGKFPSEFLGDKIRMNMYIGNEEGKLGPGFAEGGPARQNFAMGKRAFLKLLGSGAAGIAGLKSGILGLGKGAGKEVVKEVAKEAATGGAPPHFLKLVAKIKALGDDVTETAALADRQIVKKYKDFELTEDVITGRQEITRYKVDGSTNNKFEYDASEYYGKPLTEETYMSYTPGEQVFQETAKGKTKIIKTQPDYEEFRSLVRNDGRNSGEIIEEISGVSDDIFEEVGEAVPEAIRKGKADGGRIGYAGGKKVVEGLASLIKKKFGDNAITTADKLKTPQKTLDRDMFKKFKDRNPDPKREITDDEFQDLMEDVGDLDAYNFDGTIGSANKIRKEAKDYQDYMYKQYKMGKLDPVAGDKSPARKRFLEKKLEEMEGSGDSKLMSQDEIEELSTFDLGTQMDEAAKKTLPKIDDKLLKNYNKEIKEGVAKIMSDTSPEGLAKSIEIDNLMLKYPGMDKNLADQIASSSPTMKADMIAMVEQTFKMDEMGMSGDDIIQTFKNTTRTKQASGGLAAMLGE